MIGTILTIWVAKHIGVTGEDLAMYGVFGAPEHLSHVGGDTLDVAGEEDDEEEDGTDEAVSNRPRRLGFR